LIANNKTIKEIETYTTADSLAYLSLEGLRKAVDADSNFCSACFDLNYPISIQRDTSQGELFQLEGAASAVRELA
jgi:amidophosphoribosyltransferase